MRRAVMLTVALVIAAPSVPAHAGAEVADQVLCDPSDHCYTKKAEHQINDAGNVAMGGTVTSGADLAAGCWQLSAPVVLRELWPWGWRDAITLSTSERWCWNSQGRLTSASMTASTTQYAYSFWSLDSLQLEAATGNPSGGTWAYRRWGANWSECVTSLIPVCIHVHQYVGVTMRPGAGNWDVARGT